MVRSEKPKNLGLLQGLMWPQTFRVLGLPAFIFVGLSQGILPATFAIPAGIGDALIGITAPLAILAIRRGALLSWAAVVAWNILGLTDFAVAVSEGLISQASMMFTFPWVLIPTVAIPIFTALHVTSLALVMRRPMRTCFAQRNSRAE